MFLKKQQRNQKITKRLLKKVTSQPANKLNTI
jgi:hypothetical protein